MSIPTVEELMAGTVSSSGFDPLPVGWYNGVITKVEVRSGAKGPYLSIEAVVHGEEFNGRHVWGMTSFSEKAHFMPGGLANVMQNVAPDGAIPLDTGPEELPAVLAKAITSVAISFEVKNEQVKRDGNLQYLDAPENTVPEMRSKIAAYQDVDEDFEATVDAEAAGLDADLPF